MEDSRLKKVYDTIVKEGYDVPDYTTFESDMRDDKKLTLVRDRLVEDGYDLPEYEQFKIDMFGAVEAEPQQGFFTGVKAQIADTAKQAMQKPRGGENGYTFTADELERMDKPEKPQGTVWGEESIATVKLPEIKPINVKLSERQLKELREQPEPERNEAVESGSFLTDEHKKAREEFDKGLTPIQRMQMKDGLLSALNAPDIPKNLKYDYDFKKEFGYFPGGSDTEFWNFLKTKTGEEYQMKMFGRPLSDYEIAKLSEDARRLGFWGTVGQGFKGLGYGLKGVELELAEGIADLFGVEHAKENINEERERILTAQDNFKPTAEGFGGFVAEMIPQMTGTGLGLLVSAVNPVAGAAIVNASTAAQVASSMGSTALEARRAGASDAQTAIAMLLSGGAELLSEKYVNSKYIKRIMPKAADVVAEAGDKALESELNKLLQTARKELGGKFTAKTAKDLVGDMFVEGASEFSAEAVQALIPIVYEHKEDFPNIVEVFNAGLEGFAGGVFMGGIFGGTSSLIQNRANNQRRREQGFVDVANVEIGGKPIFVEVLGKDKDGNFVVLNGDETVSIKESQIKERKRFDYNDFRNAEVEYAREIGYEQEPTGENAVKEANEYTNARNEVVKVLILAEGADVDAMLEGRTAEEIAMGDTEVEDAVNNYIKARARRDGFRERYQEERDRQFAESDRSVDETANDGMVYTTTTPSGEKIVITGGKVVLDNEGYIDVNQSEGLVVMFPDGQKKPVRPGDLREKVEVSDAEETKVARRASIEDRWRAEFESAENAYVEQQKRAEGVVFDVTDKDGTHRVEVVKEGDEMSNILVDGEQMQITTEMLNALRGEAGVSQAESGEVEGENEVQPEVAPVVEDQKGENAVESSVAPVVEAPKTALEQIPRNGNNIPLYEQVDSELAWDGVVEEAGGNEEIAMVAVNSMVADKQDALKKAEKAKAKVGVTITEKIAAENERVANIEKAKADLAKWEEIAGVKAKRAAAQAENVAQPVAETAPAIESAPVVENSNVKGENGNVVETPQATNEMQEADLENAEKGEKGQKAVEPVGENNESTISQTSDQVGDQVAEGGNAPGQSGVEEIQEPRSVEEVLENGDKRITNYNSRGEVATVATERDGKVVSVDSYNDGVLFEHTEYDTNGVSTSVTRYDKQGNAIGTQVYVDGKAVPSGEVKVADEVLAMAKKKQQARFADHAKGIAEKLGVEVTVHNDESTVTNRDAMKAIAEGGVLKGWYNPNTGEIALFLPAMESMRDVESTILHEAVSHYGIKHLLGKEDFDKFLDGVWNMMPAGTRAHFLQYVGADMKNPSQEKMRQAADEYVAHIAEKMDLNELEKSVWQRFIDYVMDVLRKAGFKNLKQRDVEAVIRASYANLRQNSLPSVDKSTAPLGQRSSKVSQVTGQGETMASKKMSERRQEKNRINNVLDEVGGIIYGNKEYAKKQRLKREAERKELAKEIYSSVLKGDFNDVTLSQIDKFIEDATPANPFGRRISQRLPQRMERALRQGARTNAVDALFSRISESAVPANERFSEAGRRKIEERKKELLKGWAIATGNWHTDLKEFTDDTEPIGEGKDSKVYSSKDGRYVIKASKGKPFGKRFRPDIDNIALFNDVFRDTRYEILGYGEIDGEFVRILQQPIVDFAESTPLTSEERREYMQSLGFEPLNDANTAFADGEIVIADLQKGNVVRDAAGNISVIDADAKLHTKDVGGDYTYPPVETDLPEGTDLGGTMFRRANKNQEVFVSNAQRAVEGIKQEKATPEQWIAMLKKNGGLKAGEEAWLGLEEWLNERGKRKGESGKVSSNGEVKGESGKTDPSAAGGSSPKTGAQSTVTKQEILDFIGENKIQIEEVNYTQFGYGLMDEATRKLEAELKEIGWDAMVEKYPGFDELFEVYDGELLWSEERASVGEYEDFIIDNKIVDLDSQSNAINETREKYTTEGLERKREIALTVPTIEPYNASDEIHFGDAGNGRAVAWVRFGETTDSDGNRVLVIDEIQSKRHQDGREKGYKSQADKTPATMEELTFGEYNGMTTVSLRGERFFFKSSTSKDEILDIINERIAAGQLGSANGLVPDAPFEKNWHELAMKRMLRLAAEEGFDKVAWTTGEQQAERYNLGKAFNDIEREDNPSFEGRRFVLNGANVETFQVDENGNIIDSTIEEAKNKPLVEVVGKDMAVKMMSLENGDMLEGEDLRIGGEGMKGFYDRMLPSFVQKYTKKWGAKVGEVTMPNLGENNTMHSVDVTPEMKESVMEGQTMFRMGSRVDARMAEVASHFDGKELSAEQRAVADVFGGKADNLTISVKTQDGNTRNVEMRQGNDLAGAKHSLYAHYGTTKGVINADDLLLIPDVIANGERTENGKKAVYKLDVNGTKYTVVTYVKQNKEEFHNFYSNKKGQPSQSVNASIGDTHSARITEELASADKGSTSSAEMQEGETLFRNNVTEEEVIEQQEENEESIAKDAVTQLGEALNAPVTIIDDLNSLPENRRNKKGWFDPKTGEIVVVIPNHVSSEDAVQTVLHEVVGHRGLRAVLGEKFDEFLDDVFKNASPEVKRGISDKFFGALRKGHALTVREATEEYIAELAERGFEGYNGVWNSIKQWLKDAFRSLVGFEVTDNELRYLLWKSYNRQKSGPIETILDIAMEAKTGTGNTMFRVVEDYNKDVQGVWNKAKEGWYDEMRSIKVAQEAIEKELGREVLDSENVYLYANHLPSINKNKKEVFDNKYLKPFTSLLKKLYELEVNGQKMDEKSVERYTNAKHGIERNREMSVKKALTEVQDGEKVFNEEAYAAWAQERDAVRKREIPWAEEQRELDKVAKKYGAKIRDYSGLTAIFDAEGKMKYAQIADAAYKYVEDVESAGGKDIKELWKLIKGMTDYSLKEAYESGMMSKSTYDHIKQMYRYYVPLRGFTEQTAEDFFDYVEGDHSPLNAVVKTAKGRTSEAENIFATILNMANSAIVQGSKNRLKQRLLNLAMRSRTGLLSVDNAWYAKVGDEYIPVEYPENADEYAAFEERMKELEKNSEVVRHRPGLEIGRKVADKWNQQQHAVRVKRNGREYVVWVNGDPRLANAVNGMLRENFDETWIGALNRWRAQMVTQYSPTFIFTNLVRDVQEASMTYAVRRGTKMMGNFDLNVAANSVKMMSLYLKHKKGTLNENIPVERYFKEFLENGGETGYTEMISIEQYEKQLKKLTEGLNMKNATGRAFEAVGEGVEFANRCIENLCRFSAYQTSREAGMSILKSIEDAKEVSVNFNRKGSGAMGQKWAKAFYMFLNPAIQSLAKRILLTKKFPKKMAVVWAGEFVMGATVPLLWSLIWSMFGDDEDKDELMGNYFNLTDYRRRSGLCLPGKDGVFHIPLSHEARALYGLGELFTSYVMGHEKYDNLPIQIFNTLSQSLPLNPLDGWAPGENILESMAYSLTPDAVKPIAEVIMNRDFAGNKVHNRSDFNEFLPEYMRGKRGTADIYKSISKVLSGKEIYGKGVLDNLVGTLVNPSTIEHLVEGYLGGAYSFADKAVKTGKWILGNEEYAEFKNVPIGSSFYTSLTKYEDKPREERTRRDWEDAFKFYQQEVKYYDDKETAAKNGEKNGEESGTLVLEQMERNGEVLMVDIFNDGNDRLKELYTASGVARRNGEFEKVDEIDKQIYAEKRDIVERMEKLADDPMIGYTFKRNKIKGVYGELETYGDVRDMNVINDFQAELKPIYEGLKKAEDMTAYANEHQKEIGLYKTLDAIERGVGDYKSAMKKIGEEYPDYAQYYMTEIRTLRAGAVELINKYRNE